MLAVNVTAYVPPAFELGEAFQFDWSEEGLVVRGIYCRMQVAHLKLCASRAFWLVAYLSGSGQSCAQSALHTCALKGASTGGRVTLPV